MADDDKDSKTEQATAKHLSDAMGKGQFAKSPEVALVMTLIAALGAFSTTAGTAAREVAALATHIFGQLANIRLQLDTAPTEIHDMVIVVAKILLPIIGSCVLAGLLAREEMRGHRGVRAIRRRSPQCWLWARSGPPWSM